MIGHHPCFEATEQVDAVIWRYMDLSKLLFILENQALFFSRVDLLGDPFEGSFSRANLRMRNEVYVDIPENQRIQMFSTRGRHLQRIRPYTCVNCWRLSQYESDAMWKLYLKSGEGFAIRSTFDRFRDALGNDPQTIYIGMVRYVDFDQDCIPESNLYYPFLHKNIAFRHEAELRALISSPIDPPGATQTNFSLPPPNGGRVIQVDINRLIDRIVLAPTSPDWLMQLIVSILHHYNLDLFPSIGLH